MRDRTIHLLVVVAAVAVLALAVAGVQWARQAGQESIRPLVSAAEALPREQFLLRWAAPGTTGATYDVDVRTEDLRVLASGDGLLEPRFLVPASALAGIPAGTRILWKVDAELLEGGHVSSPTFVATVQ